MSQRSPAREYGLTSGSLFVLEVETRQEYLEHHGLLIAIILEVHFAYTCFLDKETEVQRG